MIATSFVLLVAAYVLWKLSAMVCFTAPSSLHCDSLLSLPFQAINPDSVLQKQAEKKASEPWKSNDAKTAGRDGLEFPEIEPLNDFDYTKVHPIQYRPFLTMPHVSMGKKP